jgi:hypothetical protein
MNDNDPIQNDWKRFQSPDFLAKPSEEVSRLILLKVHRDLNPSVLAVFLKIMSIHFGVTVFSLSVCPQFGFRLVGQGHGLMHWFMTFGELGCMVACGAFFTSLSLFFASIFLKARELQKLKATRWLQLMAIVLLRMLSPELSFNLSFAAWFFGAVIGGWVAMGLGSCIRVAFA